MKAQMLAGLMILATGPALADSAVVAASRAFTQCAACHQVGPTARNGIGPVLNGIVGRQPGSLPGFTYSPAMIEFGKVNGVWTRDLLAQFLADPKALVPGTKMSFAGVADESTIADLVAYLGTLSPPQEK